MSKATAIAHPIQGLLKYHGLRDPELRIPVHDSISVCVAPYETRTTVEIQGDLKEDQIEIDGKPAEGRAYERAQLVLDHLRNLSGRNERVRMVSRNNFLSNIGLGASSSGFAALAVASASAFEQRLRPRELSTIARLGGGSASRAVTGSYSHWYAGTNHENSYAERIGTGETLPLGIVMAIIPAYKTTDDAHAEVMTSPLMPCRVAYVKNVVDDMRQAIIKSDFSTLGMMAEKDTLSLHAVTMTGNNAPLYWQPQTLMVMHEVRKMRAEGLECYFSIDTGATVYINSRPADRDAVEKRIAALGVQTEVGQVGGAAQLVSEHLF